MFAGVEGKEIQCTINGYCRTQIFEFPVVDFHPEDVEAPQQIFKSFSIQATVTTNLVRYLVHSNFSKQYVIDPSMRYRVSEIEDLVRSQQQNNVPMYLVIEEVNELLPVEMKKGECSLVDEVVVRDGETKAYLVGGREGEQFIVAQSTTDGAWPELPNNQPVVNMILAGVRVGQQTAKPIPKLVDQECLVTDDGQFVTFGLKLTAEGRLKRPAQLNPTAFRSRISEIRKAVADMEKDIGSAHMELLFGAMYRDDYGNNDYRRLKYLQLWQSLDETGKKWLLYQGKDIRDSNVVLAGKMTMRELTDHRDAIAHWRTDRTSEANFADLQRTLNELLRCRYF